MSDELDLPGDIEHVLDGCVAVMEEWRGLPTIDEIITIHRDPSALDYDEVAHEMTICVAASAEVKAAGEGSDVTIQSVGSDEVMVSAGDAEAIVDVQNSQLTLRYTPNDAEEMEWESEYVGAELRYQVASDLDSRTSVGDSV